MREFRPLILAWAGLILVLLLQIGAGTWLHVPQTASLFGVVATSIVLIVFMRIRSGSSLMGLFGIAGLFWLMVFLCLGTMDPVTRTDYPAATDSMP